MNTPLKVVFFSRIMIILLIINTVDVVQLFRLHTSERCLKPRAHSRHSASGRRCHVAVWSAICLRRGPASQTIHTGQAWEYNRWGIETLWVSFAARSICNNRLVLTSKSHFNMGTSAFCQSIIFNYIYHFYYLYDFCMIFKFLHWL